MAIGLFWGITVYNIIYIIIILITYNNYKINIIIIILKITIISIKIQNTTHYITYTTIYVLIICII